METSKLKNLNSHQETLIPEIFQKQTIRKILRNKKKLENKLKVKIEIKGNRIELSGDELDIFVGEKVLEAIDKNFPINASLLLTNEAYDFEDIPIKSLTTKKTKQIKARIIGTRGRTLKTLSELSDCEITLHNNTVSILGPSENIKKTVNAIKSLIKGSKQSNVYYYLERYEKEMPQDLGLKKSKE